MNSLAPWMADAPLTFQRRVKFGECDPAGVVYTPRFVDYITEAFLDFLEGLLGGPLQALLTEHDLGMPARGLHVDFKRSLRPDQQLDLQVRVSDIRQRSFELLINAFDAEGQESFSALFSVVCVYRSQRKSRLIPSVLGEPLELYRDRFPVALQAADRLHFPEGDLTMTDSQSAQAVENANHQRYRAMIDGDMKALDQLLADDLIYLHSTGAADSKTSLVEALTQRKFVFKSAESSGTTVRVYGDVAVLNGQVKMVVEVAGTDHHAHSGFTTVWSRQDGHWRLVHWQSTPLKN